MKQRFQSELLSKGTKFEVQSVPECRKALCEHLDCVQKLRKYSGSRKPTEEGSHNNHCVGPRGLNLGRRIYSGEGRPFTVVRFRKGAGKLTPKSLGLRNFGEVYVL
jgi:hypothetical protein